MWEFCPRQRDKDIFQAQATRISPGVPPIPAVNQQKCGKLMAKEMILQMVDCPLKGRFDNVKTCKKRMVNSVKWQWGQALGILWWKQYKWEYHLSTCRHSVVVAGFELWFLGVENCEAHPSHHDAWAWCISLFVGSITHPDSCWPNPCVFWL